MSDPLDTIRKAQEDRFFKVEQEKHLQAYVKKLKASGRYDQIPAAAPRSFSASALPQVLAHQLRLSAPAEEVLERRQLDRSFMTRQIIKGVCTGDPYLINSVTLGSRVSMGKNKWSAGTNTGIENTTIFSVDKAAALMSETPKHLNGVEHRAAKHMVDNTFVEIAGKRIKLLPDPTPGRALAWGGTMAIWGTAALAVGTCKVLGIQTMEDMRRVMKAQLSPLGHAIRDRLTPFKSYIAEAPADGSPKVNTKDSRFAKGVKEIFA